MASKDLRSGGAYLPHDGMYAISLVGIKAGALPHATDTVTLRPYPPQAVSLGKDILAILAAFVIELEPDIFPFQILPFARTIDDMRAREEYNFTVLFEFTARTLNEELCLPSSSRPG